VSALLDWYKENARTLPWRSDPKPYHVLLSELMLQQTRVDTVLAYYDRFLKRWPTLSDLASATEDEVLTEWAGLGYYRRARNLHRCVRAADALGGLPSDVEGLLELPGIGPYTAGAIASIAFDVATPLVDGNVERILTRLDAYGEDPRKAAGKRYLWGRGAQFHDEGIGKPGDLNQALMELGALVCTPKKPRCETCPWETSCVARARGDIASFPKKKAKTKVRQVEAVAAVLRRGDENLLARRAGDGLLGGLWEPIFGECREDEAPKDAALRVLRERGGVHGGTLVEKGLVTHAFSHQRLRVTVYTVSNAKLDAVTAGEGYSEVRFVRDVEALGLSTLARKLLAVAS